ncbi:helix-turn-helix domain-containing protein [Apilactobacillus ozensis]|uniref:helix-turn-helix domain-containing protein n=1 Tax=Apilactobacillus ozensis TaxID=866801 RepID=UPI00200A3FB5|nr:helix-turn-helix domain-containing protein [Apilactobacillus ozensis]MCK8607789.1 helix-turn-helix domain-containing protein [Apilactobacillus ozensis]
MVKITLDKVMIDKNISSKSLSSKIGITQANLSILKNNKAKGIRFNTLDKLCNVLNCNPGDIIQK